MSEQAQEEVVPTPEGSEGIAVDDPVQFTPEPEAAGGPEYSGPPKQVKFIGPPGQECIEIGQVTGTKALEPGESYEVPQELAKALIAGSSMWEKFKED